MYPTQGQFNYDEFAKPMAVSKKVSSSVRVGPAGSLGPKTQGSGAMSKAEPSVVAQQPPINSARGGVEKSKYISPSIRGQVIKDAEITRPNPGKGVIVPGNPPKKIGGAPGAMLGLGGGGGRPWSTK